jgi:hypothetical protein
MHMTSIDGWKMAPNGVGIHPVPTPGTERWFIGIRDQRRHLQSEDRVDPTWAATDNKWWIDFFKMHRNKELRRLDRATEAVEQGQMPPYWTMLG